MKHTLRQTIRHAGIILFCVSSGALIPSVQASDFDPFIGRYAGEAKVVSSDNQSPRAVTVEISKKKSGFSVAWSTTKIGESAGKTYAIDFIPTDRPEIFAAAQKVNVFGGRQPLDPLKGDAYMWARIRGNSLKIQGLLINDEGEFEMLSYNRTLLADGKTLSLHYARFNEAGEKVVVEGTLKRLD